MGLHHVFPDAEITGVDNRPQPRYPFRFVLSNAMAFPLDRYDFIWASPPCQGYSWTKYIHHCQNRSYSKLIEPLRDRLRGHVYVIENVKGAPLINAVEICGTALGLRVRRHRLFETSFPISFNLPCRHNGDFGVYANKVTKIGTRKTPYVAGSGRIHWRPETATLAEGSAAMGINWMSLSELAQAIPPAYSEWIARQWSNAHPASADNHNHSASLPLRPAPP